MFKLGTRLALQHLKTADALRGTELLLTAAGRTELAAHYGKLVKGGATAVATGCDVSPAHLDAHGFFEDYSRKNDISYYDVCPPDQTVKQTQPSGYRHCVPRSLVSRGEKVLFSETLVALDLAAAKEGGAEAVGLAVNFGDPGAPRAMARAAKSCDFFAVTVSSVAEADALLAEVAENAPVEVTGTHVDWKGFRHDDAEPSTAGYDVPLVLVAACPAAELLAAAASPSVVGLVSSDSVEAPCAVLAPVGDGVVEVKSV